MGKTIKMLAALVCAAAWWSLFYPELCFTEETCRLVQTAEAQDGSGAQMQGGETDAAAGILRAGDEEVVISSRFLEWCGENLFDRKE